jgi:hypothetical protein
MFVGENMAKRDLIQAALNYAYQTLVVPTAGPSEGQLAEVVRNSPDEYVRTTERYLRWEMWFWRIILISLAAIIVAGFGCFVYVAAFGGNDAIKFGGLASGLTSFVGILFASPWTKAQERRAALVDIIGYNYRFLASVKQCSGDVECIKRCVKEYQDWVRSL